MRRRFGLLLFAVVCWWCAMPAVAQTCSGDCDGDGTLSIAELTAGVAIALGDAALTGCPPLDANGDGAVRIEELTRATGAQLASCAPRPAVVPRADGLVTLQIGTASGAPGTFAAFPVTLDTGGLLVAGVQVDIGYPSVAPVVRNASNRPDCVVNPAINKSATSFAFRPPGCAPGSCTAIRALVLSFSNVDPIPDGSELFTCTVQITSGASPGQYPLSGFNAASSDPSGNAQNAQAEDGAVIVGIGATATATATRTPDGQTTLPGTLVLRRARLRADTATRPGVDNGRLRIDATVDANAPSPSVVDGILTGGLSARVRTAAGVDVELDWEAGDCTARPGARGARLTCVRETGGVRRHVRFRPLATPNLYDLDLQAEGLDFAPPLSADPVQLTLVIGTSTRADEIGGCQVRGGRQQLETCRERGVQPTPTPPAPNTATGTPTGSRTPTSATRTPTTTRTPTWTATMPPNPTATRTPDLPPGSLGLRVFNIEPGVLLEVPSGTGTGLFTSGLGGANAANSFGPGPIVLAAGVPDGDGVAPLALHADATLDVSVVDGSRVCIRLRAAGSSGSIDCDGGTAHDVEASAPAGVGHPVTLTTGLGPPGDAGDATLIVVQDVQPLPPGDVRPCDEIAYGQPAGTAAYTTALGTAIKGTLELAVEGEPFDCGSWTVIGSAGRLVSPAPANQPPIGDVANVFRLDDDPDASLGTHVCTFADSSNLFLATHGLPMLLHPSGALEITCGGVAGDGTATCDCSLLSLAPLTIPAIGDVCISPSSGCPSGRVDCDGGSPADAMLHADHTIGTCASNDACQSACAATCAGFGPEFAVQSAGCEGYCLGGSQHDAACLAESDCPGGTCVGGDPPSHAGLCNCSCQGTGLGAPAGAGVLSCQVGMQVSVELPSDGDCLEADSIVLPPLCGALTTAMSTGQIGEANSSLVPLPPSPHMLGGEAVGCGPLAAGSTTGMMLVGHLAFYDSTLGDVLAAQELVCE